MKLGGVLLSFVLLLDAAFAAEGINLFILWNFCVDCKYF